MHDPPLGRGSQSEREPIGHDRVVRSRRSHGGGVELQEVGRIRIPVVDGGYTRGELLRPAHLTERWPEGEAAPTIVDGARSCGTGVNFVGSPPLLGAVALDRDTPVLGASLVKGFPSVAWLGRG